VGAQFGVILVMDGEIPTEVATFRLDGCYLDARHPSSVTFGAAPEDARRRDFTINALFYDPAEDRVLDFVGGGDDLQAKILRAIGEPAQRFQEDALRLLRAVRFAVRFELEIEPRTRAALLDLAPNIEKISADRIRDELARILTGPRPGRALRLMDSVGLLAHMLPEVAEMKGVPQPEAFHPEGDVFTHTALALDRLPPSPSVSLAFGALLHDIGKPPTIEHADRIRFSLHHSVGAEIADAFCRRLHFSNADRKQIVELVARHMDFMNVAQMRPARLRRLLALDRFEEHLELHRIDCLASHGNLDNYEYCKARLEEYTRADAGPVLPPRLLTGDDLIAVGYTPGPYLGRILQALRDAQLNGELSDPAVALEWVRSRYPLEET